MAFQIVLSPSQQTNNKCILGDTEAQHMRAITEIINKELSVDPQLEVLLIPVLNGDDNSKLTQATTISNNFVAKSIAINQPCFHICLHSDAGYNSHGATAYWYADGGLGQQLGLAIYNKLSALTPWTDGVRVARPGLWELKVTNASSVLIETSFHDQLSEATFIHEKKAEIAECFISAIYDVLAQFGVKRPEKIKLTYKEIIQKVSTNPDKWIKAYDMLIEFAKAKGDLGDIEVCEYLGDLLVKAYYADRSA